MPRTNARRAMNYNSSSSTVYNKSNTSKYPSFGNNYRSSSRSSISSIENNSDSELVYSSDENEAPLESEPTKKSQIERDHSSESESIEQERTSTRLSDSDNSSKKDFSYNNEIKDKSYGQSFNHTISNTARIEDKYKIPRQSSARNDTRLKISNPELQILNRIGSHHFLHVLVPGPITVIHIVIVLTNPFMKDHLSHKKRIHIIHPHPLQKMSRERKRLKAKYTNQKHQYH